MERDTSSYYKRNRAEGLRNTLRSERLQRKLLGPTLEGELVIETPNLYDPTEDHTPEDYTVTVNKQFLDGTNKVVDAYVDDLYRTGPGGKEIIERVAEQVREEDR